MNSVKNISLSVLNLFFMLFMVALISTGYFYCVINRIPIIAGIFFLIFIGILVGILVNTIFENSKVLESIAKFIMICASALTLIPGTLVMIFLICNFCAFGAYFLIPITIGFGFLSLIPFYMLIPLTACLFIYEEYDSEVKYVPIACILAVQMYCAPNVLGFLGSGAKAMAMQALNYFGWLSETWSVLL